MYNYNGKNDGRLNNKTDVLNTSQYHNMVYGSLKSLFRSFSWGVYLLFRFVLGRLDFYLGSSLYSTLITAKGWNVIIGVTMLLEVSHTEYHQHVLIQDWWTASYAFCLRFVSLNLDKSLSFFCYLSCCLFSLTLEMPW